MSVSILVVDDKPDVALRRAVRGGADVMHFADSGERALETVPGMDGLQLLGAIKKLRPRLPVMRVTAYGDDERRQRASRPGVVEFITKPIDFDLLKAQLQQQLADAVA